MKFWVENSSEIDLNFIFYIKLWFCILLDFLSTNGWFIAGTLDWNKLIIYLQSRLFHDLSVEDILFVYLFGHTSMLFERSLMLFERTKVRFHKYIGQYTSEFISKLFIKLFRMFHTIWTRFSFIKIIKALKAIRVFANSVLTFIYVLTMNQPALGYIKYISFDT